MGRMLTMCFNPRVLLMLGLVAVGLLLVAPGAALAALPALIAVACPLSMAFMAVSMARGARKAVNAGAAFSCSEHPHVRATFPADCPVCGVPLTSLASSLDQSNCAIAPEAPQPVAPGTLR